MRDDHADYLPPKKSHLSTVRTANEMCEGLEDVSTARVEQTLKRKRRSIPDVTIDGREQRQSKQRKGKKEKKGKNKEEV